MSFSRKIALIVAILVLLAGASKISSGFVTEGIKNKKQRITEIIGEIQNLELAELELVEGQSEKALIEELSLLDQTIPKQFKADRIIENLMLGYQPRSSIEFIYVTPQPIQVGEMKEAPDGSPMYGPSILPIRMRFVSGFSEMVRYLNHIEELGWILSTRELTARLGTRGSRTLDVTALVDIAVAPLESSPTPHENRPTEPDPRGPISQASAPDPKSARLNIRSMTFVPTHSDTAKKGSNPGTSSSLKGSPSLRLDGILGTQIVINGTPYRKGDVIEGWTITAIDKVRNEVGLVQGRNRTVLKVDP